MAVFPVAAGHPDYSGKMIPEIWSPKLLYKFYKATVFGEIANTDYEGEISSQGDTVHIRTTPDIIINDYVKGQKLDYQTPEPTLVDLLIDKGKSWSFLAEDVDKIQSDYAYVEDWTADASIQLRIKIDSDILGAVYADAHASNKGATAGVDSSSYDLGATGSPLAVDKTNVVEVIQDCGSVLDEQNVPEEDRWIVLPTWMINRIGKSDLKDASLSGDSESISRNGRTGMIDRFVVYRSNQLSKTTDGSHTVTNALFGHRSGITFASQLLQNEGPMRDISMFGDFYRGLQVFGYKVIKTEAIGHLYARPA